MTDGNSRLVRLAVAHTARRYRGCRPFTRHYVASKLRRDPVHAALIQRADADGYGAVADLGCGRGQAGLLLLEAGLATRVTGLDWSGPALAEAQAAAAGLPYAAHAQDFAADPEAPSCGTALLIDVLYQLGPDAAARLLSKAAAAARRRVLVRTLDPALGCRSAFAIGLERLARLGWPTSGRHVAPTPVADLCGLLEAAGFTVEAAPSWQGTPFANVLLDARRKPDGSAGAANPLNGPIR